MSTWEAQEQLRKTTFQDAYFDQFVSILKNYQDILAPGLMAGHIHRDMFSLISPSGDSSEAPVAFQQIPGAISPIDYSNPAYRVVSFDSSSFEQKDYKTYTFDMQAQNWGQLYQFTNISNGLRPTLSGYQELWKQMKGGLWPKSVGTNASATAAAAAAALPAFCTYLNQIWASGTQAFWTDKSAAPDCWPVFCSLADTDSSALDSCSSSKIDTHACPKTNICDPSTKY